MSKFEFKVRLVIFRELSATRDRINIYVKNLTDIAHVVKELEARHVAFHIYEYSPRKLSYEYVNSYFYNKWSPVVSHSQFIPQFLNVSRLRTKA